MKALLSLALTALCCIGAADASQRRKRTPKPPPPIPLQPLVETRYDKMYDHTTVSTGPILSPAADVMVSFHFSYNGTSRYRDVEEIRALFIASPQAWGRSGLDNLVALLVNDTQPSKRLLVTYSSLQSAEGLVFLTYSSSLPINDFREIACAKTLDVKVGIRNGNLSPKDLTTLRALLTATGHMC